MVFVLLLKKFLNGTILCTKTSFNQVSHKHMTSMVAAVSQVHKQKTFGENQSRCGFMVNQSSGVISKQFVACLKNDTF